MLKLITTFSAAFSALAITGLASAAASGPVLVTAPVERAFVPLGFDDNDNAEVIVHGHFPSTCYKMGPATASVDLDTNKITVVVKAWHYAGVFCAQIMVPFLESVKLGPLPVGEYQVEVVDRPGTPTRPLSIVEASSRNPDDFLYGPVDNVAFSTGPDGNHTLILQGTYPHMLIGCMKIVEVREQVTPGNVIVVQPIARIFEREEDCRDQSRSKKFEVTKLVTDARERTEYLAHVRVLGGQSVNRLFDFAD